MTVKKSRHETPVADAPAPCWAHVEVREEWVSVTGGQSS